MSRDPSIDNRPVLLIEDDIELGELVVDRLDAEGYQTTWVKSWNEGRAYLDKQLPDLLVMDIGLPDGDGIEILNGLREDKRTQDLAAIITSARSDTEDLLSGIRTGALYYVTKPYDLEELVQKVRSAVFHRFEMPVHHHPSSTEKD